MLERLQQKISLFWQFQILGWLAFGVAMAFSRVGVYPFSYMAVDKTILAGLGILLSLLLRYFYQRLRSRQLSLVYIIIVSAITSCRRRRMLPSSNACSKKPAIRISKFSCCSKPITA